MADYQSRLFATYQKTHLVNIDPEDHSKIAWFLEYSKNYYYQHIVEFDKNRSNILEIGCNKGYLLYALSKFGYKNLVGLDLSVDDVRRAREIVPTADVVVADAFDYLEENLQKFDVIMLKAVLEHIRKEKVLPFLDEINRALRKNGIVIIDVPNMDWLFASHERYMDFTHETGFTKESLSQLMNNVFSDVRITPVDHIMEKSFLITAKKRISRYILTKLFGWADPLGVINPIWCRSLVAVGKKK